MDALQSTLHRIRDKAREQRELFGNEGIARGIEWAAAEVERALEEDGQQLLTAEEAAERSGYSADHLARLVREKKLPDLRPGGRGRLRFRAADLPSKPAKPHTPSADVHELASRLLGGTEGR